MAFYIHNGDVMVLTAGEQTKPKIITFYNTIKGGVDNVNELFPLIYIGQMTRRWLMMTFFYDNLYRCNKLLHYSYMYDPDSKDFFSNK